MADMCLSKPGNILVNISGSSNKILGLLDARTLGHIDTRMLGHLDARILGYKDITTVGH